MKKVNEILKPHSDEIIMVAAFTLAFYMCAKLAYGLGVYDGVNATVATIGKMINETSK